MHGSHFSDATLALRAYVHGLEGEDGFDARTSARHCPVGSLLFARQGAIACAFFTD